MLGRVLAARTIPVLLVTAVTLAAGASAAPTPQKPGWVVRLVASGFSLNFNGLAYDPITTDLFTTDFNTSGVYRVTQSGVVTQIYSAAGSGLSCDEMAFDPGSRTLFFGGVAQTTLRRISEFGAFIEDITVPSAYTGLAFGPGGFLYLDTVFDKTILRYNPVTHAFSTWASGVGTGTLEGLSFDPAGNAYVCGYGDGQEFKVTPANLTTGIGAVPVPIGSAWGMGFMFVTDWQAGNIWCVADDGSGQALFATGHAGTAGIAFANNGNVYVNDSGAGQIWEYSMKPTPARTLTWGGVKARYR